jgi:hypothetical protein
VTGAQTVLTFDRSLTLDEQFQKWAKENPAVIDCFLRFAREARDAGRRRFGIQMIAERVRWYTAVESKKDDFKVNNSFLSRLARLLVDRDLSLCGLFEFRELKSRKGKP